MLDVAILTVHKKLTKVTGNTTPALEFVRLSKWDR